jgi:hypothetical protein
LLSRHFFQFFSKRPDPLPLPRKIQFSVGDIEADGYNGLHSAISTGRWIGPYLTPPEKAVRQALQPLPFHNAGLTGFKNTSHRTQFTRFGSLLVIIIAKQPNFATVPGNSIVPQNPVVTVDHVAVEIYPVGHGRVENHSHTGVGVFKSCGNGIHGSQPYKSRKRKNLASTMSSGVQREVPGPNFQKLYHKAKIHQILFEVGRPAARGILF